MLIVLAHASEPGVTAVIVDRFVLRHTDLDEFAARLLHEVPRVERVRIYSDDRGTGQPEVDTDTPVSRTPL